MNVNAHMTIDAIMLFINLLVLAMGLKVNAAIAELKAHMYEHFMTKKDYRTINDLSKHTHG